MDNRKQIMIGDYRVQQASNRHVPIVHMPEKHLVFHAEVDHWCSESELRDFWTYFEELKGSTGAEAYGKPER